MRLVNSLLFSAVAALHLSSPSLAKEPEKDLTDIISTMIDSEAPEARGAPEYEGDDSLATTSQEPVRPMHERLNADVRSTWDNASVFLPGRRWSTRPGAIDLTTPSPVVLYLHGCTGITTFNDTAWARFLADAGFVVVLPDSFARSSRRSNCDPRTSEAGFFPLAHILRYEEIVWARHKLSQSAWADQKNIFLMGHSEGGYAVTKYADGGFRGVIISGYDCHWAQWERGIPALAVNYETDPWYKNQSMRCADRSGGRAVEDVILTGHAHDTYFRAEAREAVKRFLNQHKAK